MDQTMMIFSALFHARRDGFASESDTCSAVVRAIVALGVIGILVLCLSVG